MNCPKCNESNAEASAFCAKCGEKLTAGAPQSRKVSLLFALGLVFFPLLAAWFTLRKGFSTKVRGLAFGWAALVLVGMNAGPKNSAPSVASNAPQEQPQAAVATHAAKAAPPAIVISPRDIMQEYAANEVAADEKFKGKTVRLTGKVNDIKKGLMDELYITFETGEVLQGVQVFFDDEHKSQLASLKKGQKLTVQGRVDGLLMNVLIKDAAIVQ